MTAKHTIPVTIVGGYLGSGKTTLINHLLRSSVNTRLAILVNDFGELPIDADLIEAEEDDIINLSGGCVCCSYGDDLSAALITLQKMSPAPDHIVIEASGVALPGAIGNSLTLHRHLLLQSTVVIADALAINTQAQDKYIADTIERQLTDADLIILNKIDLVYRETASATKGWLSSKYREARLITATNSQVPIEILLHNAPDSDSGIQTQGSGTIAANNQRHDPTIFQTVEIKLGARTDIAALAKKLSEKECALVRAKGFATDLDGLIKTIQVVGRCWSVTTAPTGVDTGIVCIGRANEFSEHSIKRHCGLD